MVRRNLYRGPVSATVVASLLMLLFGGAYRTMAIQFRAPPSATPITADALTRFPMRINNWMGEDIPLDEAIIRRTSTDSHINRRYLRGGLESVSLYVGCGAKVRELMPHRPEVCYIGAGWTRTDRQLQVLPLSSGKELPCIIFEFSRGTLGTSKIVVLHYYVVDGQCCRDLSEWRYRFWNIGYVAQVQVVASLEAQTAGEATRIVSEFATASAPHIAEVFRQIERSRGTDTSVGSGEQK